MLRWCLQLTQPVFSNTLNFTDSRTNEPVDHSDCSLIKWEGQPPLIVEEFSAHDLSEI